MLPRRLVQTARLEAAQRVLSQWPKNSVALKAAAEATIALAEEERLELRAAALTKLLERPVSTRQADRPAYAPYQQAAIDLISTADRERLAKLFAGAEQRTMALAAVSPSNALAVSLAAVTRDESRFWAKLPRDVAQWHRYAVAQYPSSTPVLSRASWGFSQVLVEMAQARARTAVLQEWLDVMGRLVTQLPAELRWILPLVDQVGLSSEAVASLIPPRIEGQELYARWRIQRKEWREALSALDAEERLNDARLDDEKPWSMGRVAYLAREKREKVEVAQAVDEWRLKAYEGLEDLEKVAEVTERLRVREAVMNEARLARADDLIARGEWGIADELLKRMPRDARALVRRAEMAVSMNRTEGAGQRLKAIDALAEESGEAVDDETARRADAVREKLAGLVPVKDAQKTVELDEKDQSREASGAK